VEGLKFICNESALTYGDMLVVADLHLGVERSIFGGAVELDFFSRARERLLRLIYESGCEELVLLGDVKHDIPNMPFPDRGKLGEFLKELDDRVHLSVVVGNHDGGIKELAGGIEVHGAAGMSVGNVSFSHGHAWPSERMMGADWLVLAHNHPCIEFRDRLGYRSIEKVWIVGEIDARKVRRRYKSFNKGMRVVVMPAFSELVGGMVFNSVKGRELLGPFFRNEMFKLDDAETFLLNGINLGRLKDMRQR